MIGNRLLGVSAIVEPTGPVTGFDMSGLVRRLADASTDERPLPTERLFPNALVGISFTGEKQMKTSRNSESVQKDPAETTLIK
jgi:hypothetical protein